MRMVAASDGNRRQAAVEQLDPVLHGTLRATGKMHQTADIRRRNDIRLTRLETVQLVQLELLREIGVQNRVSTCRPAAQVRVGHRRQLEADRLEEPFDLASKLLPVL